MKISMPEQAGKLIQTLNDHGYEAYIVGGCVRDVLLGKIPGDWDITTSAKPEEVKALFRRTIDTGIEHGTVTVLMGDEAYEVTTYREDGEYTDGRHPKEVTFVPNLEEDLRRRDFTINAMAYNDRMGLVDLYGGMEDLREGVIRCVGAAEDRFNEDALRMMRAVRFAGQTGFYIDEETVAAIKTLHANIRKVSAERIQVELVKLMCSEYPQLWETACEQELCREVLPEFDALMHRRVQSEVTEPGGGAVTYGRKALQMAALMPADKVIRLAALMVFLGLDDPEAGRKCAYEALRRLKFDNDTTRKVSALVEYYYRRIPAVEAEIRKALCDMGEELFFANLLVQHAGSACVPGRDEEDLRRIAAVWELAEEILERGDCISLKGLHITGNDLMEAGIGQGKMIGTILKALLEKVLEDPDLNEKEMLKRMAEEIRRTMQ